MQIDSQGQEIVEQCGICGGKETDRLFAAEDHIFGHVFSLVKCRRCSFVYTNPRPNPEYLGRYYPNSYYGIDGLRFRFGLEKVVHFFRQRLTNRIENKFDHPGWVLEVGSGRGTLLKELHLRGWQAVGTEYSTSIATSTSKHMGIQIFHSPDLVECKFPDNQFDLIVCYHVLEHLTDPLKTLAEMRRILKCNGVLIVAVPNFGGWVSQLTREHWFAIDVPRHLSHFTPQTLERAFDSTGFVPFQKTTLSLEQDVFGFAQSILNMVGFQFNAFYDLIRGQNAKLRPITVMRSGDYIKLFYVGVFGIMLCLIGLPFVILASLFHKGGTLAYWTHPSPPLLESS